MEWSIEEIEQHLLHGKITDIALPSEKIVGAVNRVGHVLGSEWITSENKTKDLRPDPGLYCIRPTIFVWGFGYLICRHMA